MGLLRRKPKLPPAARPPLSDAERVLAWAAAGPGAAGAEGGAEGGGGGVLVATNLGLWLPGRDARLGWHDVLKAVWSGRELTVTPAERVAERAGYVVVADGPVETYLLLAPAELPHQVRARVTRSVAYTQHHPVPGGAGRIAARRVPGVDGLTWTVRYDPGTPTDDEPVVAETDRLVAAARAATAPTDL
ncbi:hypothetical protein [Micromonospora carbonacea]|uniref:Uncharacterized protein n=1 Tax=Micromonospora carbonacea TaxID=47853 RepID=A0A7H8XPL4_9ACTN|nr:hypothetical protein [Micromonospora carbonacea]MBB5824915.1 hypothetical protein [Micromonospora carbonacea]QLD26956.1 hypothetical protein HXZ27_24340 [Micromonospora carbonacea]